MKKSVFVAAILAATAAAAVSQSDPRVTEITDRFYALESALKRTPAEWEESGKAVREYRESDPTEFEFVDHEDLPRLQRIVDAIVAVSHNPDLKIEVKVYKSSVMNAQVWTNELIYVSTGLLDSVRDEHQLTAVLAHETAHIMSRTLERLIEFAEKIEAKSIEDLRVKREQRWTELEADVVGAYYAWRLGVPAEAPAKFFEFAGRAEDWAVKSLKAEHEKLKASLADAATDDEHKQFETKIKENEKSQRNLLISDERTHPFPSQRAETAERVFAYLNEHLDWSELRPDEHNILNPVFNAQVAPAEEEDDEAAPGEDDGSDEEDGDDSEEEEGE